jgi:[acyl-carrier-protein] S-malonyltransferase
LESRDWFFTILKSLISITIAFLFPGQGSQYIGMAKDLYDHFEEVRELFEKGNEVLGVDIANLSFHGPEEELRSTQNTQVAILLHSLACQILLEKRGIQPSIAAGHSVGEYSAIISAGSLNTEKGIRLVRLRGELMFHAGETRPGGMAAILGLSEEKVIEICKEISDGGYGEDKFRTPNSEISNRKLIVSPANFNSPSEIVISGDRKAVEEASRLAKEKGAKRSIILNVSGAFHSELMRDASQGLFEALSSTDFENPRFPIVSNVSAEPSVEADSIREALKKQLTHPVRWVDSIRKICSEGINTFVEVGPGKILKGLLKRIDPGSQVFNVEDSESLETTVRELETRN